MENWDIHISKLRDQCADARIGDFLVSRRFTEKAPQERVNPPLYLKFVELQLLGASWCPINKHANARAIFSPDKLGTEKSLAPRVERHGVASGVRTNPQCRQAFRVCPALLSTP